MVGNFHGELSFVIFMVDLAVTKFFYPQKLMVICLCESMMMGMVTNARSLGGRGGRVSLFSQAHGIVHQSTIVVQV